MSKTKVFTCGFSPLEREGLEKVLSATSDLEYSGFTLDLGSFFLLTNPDTVEVLIVRQRSSLKSLRQFILMVAKVSRCLIVLWMDQPSTKDYRVLLRLGVKGFLNPESLVELIPNCLRAITRGEIWFEDSTLDYERFFKVRDPRLTRRELEVVQLILEGKDTKEIGKSLSISPKTVQVHQGNIFLATGVKSREELLLVPNLPCSKGQKMAIL